ncbi:hypothetical protein SAMN02910298_02905 [Pseudobutyrivibrio sp. YE44]|uniref:hypothetical protein n=1 Tax=Pseudobutyrivibrio sp. YE44 TaxID=1520802 RepID=UPI000889D3C3|nr:hypothetical protein [Pseudobutyrivibrio sp. YE44]SDB56235.1 hypothetical protein SAMN02910298_02905 [Pseudobutyrivibrio sp. YE44]
METCNKVLCAECMSLEEYFIESEIETRTIKDSKYKFVKNVARCKCCGKKVMVPGLEDENERKFEFIYRDYNGYIQIDEIKDILEKSNIEKQSLEQMLELEDGTIGNYIAGQLPSRDVSDRLKELV